MAPPVVRAKVSVLARALEWQAMIRQPGIGNRAGLAAKLGVSRARITQGMAVLAAPQEVLEAIRRMEASGVPMTERLWRRVAQMPPGDAVRVLATN